MLEGGGGARQANTGLRTSSLSNKRKDLHKGRTHYTLTHIGYRAATLHVFNLRKIDLVLDNILDKLVQSLVVVLLKPHVAVH